MHLFVCLLCRLVIFPATTTKSKIVYYSLLTLSLSLSLSLYTCVCVFVCVWTGPLCGWWFKVTSLRETHVVTPGWKIPHLDQLYLSYLESNFTPHPPPHMIYAQWTHTHAYLTLLTGDTVCDVRILGVLCRNGCRSQMFTLGISLVFLHRAPLWYSQTCVLHSGHSFDTNRINWIRYRQHEWTLFWSLNVLFL